MDQVFPVDPPYGAQMDWFLHEKPGKQAVQMDKVMTCPGHKPTKLRELRKHHSHYWVCFTGPGALF